MNGNVEDTKIAMTFAQYDKPLILNVTNIKTLQSIFGDDAEPRDMIGATLVLYNVPTQTPQGAQVFGLRMRAAPPENLRQGLGGAAPQPPINNPAQAARPLNQAGSTPSDVPPTELNPPPPTDADAAFFGNDTEESPF
jgi:hypothetical protein